MMDAPRSCRLLSAATAAASIALLAFLPAARADVAPRLRESVEERIPASVEERMWLPGTHGYELTLSVNNGEYLQLEASRKIGAHGREEATYESTLRAHPGDRIETNLGRIGRLNLRFVRRSSRSFPASGCRGSSKTVEKGRFVGRFDFRGEHGFTVVHRHSIPGIVIHTAANDCAGSSRAPLEARGSAAPEYTYLLSGSKRFNEQLEAIGLRRSGKNAKKATYFRADFGYSDHGLHVLTIATVDAHSLGPFTVPAGSTPPEEATVSPPAPFIGAATFSLRSPDRADWAGDLAVRMPGLGPIRLAGSTHYVALCRKDICTHTLPPNKKFLLEPAEIESDEDAGDSESLAPLDPGVGSL